MTTTGDRVLHALQAYNLKREASGQYRANTPWRAGSDAQGLRVSIDPDGEHGKWHDKVSHESGSLYELAEKLKLREAPSSDPAPQLIISSSKRRYRDGAEYAAQHGLTWEQLRGAGWKEVRKYNRPALEFPTANGPRWRFLDGAKPPYINTEGYQRCWYRLTEALALRGDGPLVICNGEISTLTAQLHGLPALALAGGTEEGIPAARIAELKQVYQGRVLIALDCDLAGRNGSEKIHAALTEAGFDAEIVDLGGSTGFDLADFVRLHGRDAMAQLTAGPDAAPAAPDWLTKGVTARTLQTTTFRAMRWPVQDILGEGVTLLAGKPKTKKSWLALGIGWAVTANQPALGRLDVMPGRVLYLDLESNQRRMQSRLRAMLGDTPWPENLHVYTEWPRGEAGIRQLETWMQTYPDTAVIVVDILQNIRPPRVKGANPYDEDYEAIKPLNAFAEAHHVAVMALHHTRKAKGDDVMDEISGTTGLSGGAAAMWVLSRAQGGDTILSLRGRDIVVDDDLALEWNDYLCRHTILGNAAQYAVSEERKAVLAILDDDAEHGPKEIAEQLHKSVAAVKMLLAHLLDQGAVDKAGYGKYVIVRKALDGIPTPRPFVAPPRFDVPREQVQFLKDKLPSRGPGWAREHMEKVGAGHGGFAAWPLGCRVLVERAEHEAAQAADEGAHEDGR